MRERCLPGVDPTELVCERRQPRVQPGQVMLGARPRPVQIGHLDAERAGAILRLCVRADRSRMGVFGGPQLLEEIIAARGERFRLLAQRPQSLVHLGVLALQPLQILRQPLPLAGGRPQPFLQDLHRRLPTREVLDELQQGALGIFPQPRHLDGARAIMIDLAADLGRRRRGRLQLLANGVCLRGDALQVCDDATGVVYLQGQLKGPNLTGMGLVSCRSLRLRPELLQLRRELCQDVGDPQEVGGRVPEAALRLTAPPLVARQARSLLQELPALFRTGVEHAVDLALSNQRVRPAAQPRPEKQHLDVAQPADGVIEEELPLPAAVGPTHHRHFGVVDRQDTGIVVDREGNFGLPHSPAGFAATKDEIVQAT